MNKFTVFVADWLIIGGCILTIVAGSIFGALALLKTL
tara:strand:- start:62 stop:172 length:111 start_codon:yes stop_codon:yes gene_type:complete